MLGLLCEQSLATHLMLWKLPMLTWALPPEPCLWNAPLCLQLCSLHSIPDNCIPSLAASDPVPPNPGPSWNLRREFQQQLITQYSGPCSNGTLTRSYSSPAIRSRQPRAGWQLIQALRDSGKPSPCFCSAILCFPPIFCLMVTRWLLPFQTSSLHYRQNI